ncbi:MAG: biopolymer transporter ExbD [Terracidiphilus sp.]
MTATNGDTRGVAFDINVAPMIDVLLVLLIIFMVIVPAVPRGDIALLTHPMPKGSPGNDAVVLEVIESADNAIEFRINQQQVAQGELQSRLAAIYANRAQRVLFIKGDDRLSFTRIAEVIDIGHVAGVDQIGLITPKVLAGQ